MSAQSVDVLEVLDQAIQREKDAGQAYVAQAAAQAAVAELIENANALLSATGKASTYWPLNEEKRMAWNALDRAVRKAVGADPNNGTTDDAVKAAIAGVGGAT